ncbi:MAG: hypothetical protein GC200_06155 [Tepidisphaera sp.]|nr:hypothetical protein [Tepidisphaera sp.]
MSTPNTQRVLSRIVRRLCERRGICVADLSEGWILRLTRGETVRHIHGYSFDLNGAATHAIACDKAATSDVLLDAGVARVEHRLFLHPEMARYVRHPGNWAGMLECFERCGRDVVIKDNTGTGGRDVFRARSLVAMEEAVLKLFSRGAAVALCPFVEVEQETRLVLLDGEVMAAYAKERQAVTGDGRRTVLELVAGRVAGEGLTADLGRYLASVDAEAAAVLGEVPRAGETRLLNWRHNLGQGASVRLIGVEMLRPHVGLALAAAKALNLRFGSVDVVSVGGKLMVLEVNSGVMMEALAGVTGGAALAEEVYGRALDAMFG